MRFTRFAAFLLIVLLPGCRQQAEPVAVAQLGPFDAEYLHVWNKALTDVIIYDIFSPPVASRIYSYPNVAAYEALVHAHPEYRSLVGQLNQLGELPQPEPGQEYHYVLASAIAYGTVARGLIFTETSLTALMDEAVAQVRADGVAQDMIDRSVAFGRALGAAVLDWCKRDNYGPSRTMTRFTVLHDREDAWLPTAPDYMDALEPNWMHIRPFTLASADEFRPPPPPPYDPRPGSEFHRDMMEVYEVSRHLTEDQIHIARFWDDNPAVSSHDGHMMSVSKKMTPGGHWIAITKQAARLKNLDAMATAEAYTLVSIGLADAFISCWEEKYRSLYIRPVTVIGRLVDRAWQPVLQTPAFPEYTSGHSVISSSAATVLTHLLGDDFAFTDSSEVEFGRGVRSFTSFRHASSEAAMSRLFGGIHFRPAIENGVRQGTQIGEHVVSRVKTRG
jgi:hypothetical protein